MSRAVKGRVLNMSEFTPKDRFYDPLVAFLAGHIGVTLALIHQRKQALPALEGKLGGIAATACGLVIWYEILPLLRCLEAGSWPALVRYKEEPIPNASQLPAEVFSNTSRVHSQAAQAMFVQYADGVEEEMRLQQRNPLVQFGTRVRNCAAHGGRIRIHPQSPAISWKTVTWDSGDDNRPLLQGDIKTPGGALSAGDLIVLMRELDAAI